MASLSSGSSSPRRMPGRALATFFGLMLGLSMAGCPAIFPELSTKTEPAPALGSFDPPPPPDRHYIVVKGAKLPNKTRDGRDWSEVFGSLPDPYLKVIVNEQELFRTSVESDNLNPKWTDAPKGNWPLKVGDRLKLEIWDDNPLIDHPIGTKEIHVESDFFGVTEQEFDFEGGAELRLTILPAKPAWGAGVWFELHNASASISRILDGSPASRAGIRGGDKILNLSGKPIASLSSDDVTGLFRSIPANGLSMTLQHDDGSTLQVSLKEGPIYALYKDYGDPDKKAE